MRRDLITIVIGGLLGCGASALAQDQWADLRIRFVLEGKAPKPQPIAMVNDQCLAAAPHDESLRVSRQNNGIADVVVFIWTPPKGKLPPIHPDYEKSEHDPVTIDNKDCQFVPRVAIKRTTQDLVLANSDAFGHNCKADFFNCTSFNQQVPGGTMVLLDDQKAGLNKAEVLPMPVVCNIHRHMRGNLFIREDPYAAVSDADGNVVLKSVPVGKWTIGVWHERSGSLSQVKIGGKGVTWTRGRFEVTIPKEGLDVGVITVPRGVMKL